MAPHRAHRRLAPRILVLLLIAVAVSACAEPDAAPTSAAASASLAQSNAPSAVPSGEAEPYPVTVTDDTGREVEIATEPERIVSLAPSNTEIVCALGACERLVGVTDFDDYPPEVADVDDVVIAATVDVELVVAAEPDLVLAAGNELTPTAVIDELVELGLTVLVLYPETLDEVYGDIELVASALDRSGEADEIVAGMEERVDAVVEAVAGADRPLTLYENFYAEGTTYTAGEGSFLAALIDLAAAEPVTGDAQGVIGAEDLVAANPELILLGSATYDPSLVDPEAAMGIVSARPGWAELAAVQAGAVLPYLHDIITTRPGPRIVDGLEALANAIHPDLVPAPSASP